MCAWNNPGFPWKFWCRRTENYELLRFHHEEAFLFNPAAVQAFPVRGGQTQFVLNLGRNEVEADQLADQLAQEARRAFEEHWTEDVVMEQYLNVVRQVAFNRGNERVMSALGGIK